MSVGRCGRAGNRQTPPKPPRHISILPENRAIQGLVTYLQPSFLGKKTRGHPLWDQGLRAAHRIPKPAFVRTLGGE